jgi:FtsP/CotA-like multicopper oxidase with cupredoxin domain
VSRGTRLGLLGVAVVIAIVAVVIASSGGSDNKDKSKSADTVSTSTGTATPKPVAIVVRNAKPVGGIRKIEVKKGDRVRFSVTSDVADEIHVHGYDFHKDVPAGGKVSFSFPATIAGGFEIELEGRKEQIADLTVQP